MMDGRGGSVWRAPWWLIAAFGLCCWALPHHNADAAQSKPIELTPHVTPVQGQSWLRHLGLSKQHTAMGQMGVAGVRPLLPRSPPWGESSVRETLDRPFTLTGADLYRLACQSCHNVEGRGLPPEIGSLLDPVRATSPDFIRGEMGKRGVRLDEATLRQTTSQAEAALHERLKNGGDKMPAFRHLQEAEVEALLGYLRALAGVPLRGTDADMRVTEPMVRVGEHLVKGTCFICHDATGPGRDAIVRSPGLIPSLSSFLEQNPVSSVVQKVREGAPAPGMPGLKGEMPVFSYLTAEEVSAAYMYLMIYPPRP